MTCPTCKQSVRKDTGREDRPFCSTRCKAIDLGRWLNEEYIIHESIMGSDEAMAESANDPKTAFSMDAGMRKQHLH